MLSRLRIYMGQRIAKDWRERNRKNRKRIFLFSGLIGLMLMLTLWLVRGQIVYGHGAFAREHSHRASARADNASLIAQSPRSIDDLTGRWTCDDGGTYFLRKIGNVLWWYGESTDAGTSWSNVFRGIVQGNQINGQWADVPKGKASSGGEMSLVLEQAFTLKAISKTGGFGGGTWTFNNASSPSPPVPPVVQPPLPPVPKAPGFPRFLGVGNDLAVAKSNALKNALQELISRDRDIYRNVSPSDLNYRDVSKGDGLQGNTRVTWVMVELVEKTFNVPINCPPDSSCDPLQVRTYLKDPRRDPRNRR
jgi:hypothetical protein